MFAFMLCSSVFMDYPHQSLCSLKMPWELQGSDFLSLNMAGKIRSMQQHLYAALISGGYVTGWSRDSQGANVQAAYQWPFPMPRSWERVQGEKLARSVTQIFSSLKTEALTQDILLHDGSFRRRYLGESVCEAWSQSPNRGLGEVWLFQGRTIPGNIGELLRVTHA